MSADIAIKDFKNVFQLAVIQRKHSTTNQVHTYKDYLKMMEDE